MADSSLLLGEQFAVPRNTRCSAKASVFLSLLVGLGLAAVLIVRNGSKHAASYPWRSPLTMASQHMRPTMTQQIQPTMTQRFSSGGAMQARDTAAKAKLIGSSPLAKLAITSIEAANQCTGKPLQRDISVMANLNSKDQMTLRAVGGAVAAKAREMSGVTKPLGFWDPFGFSTTASEGKLLFYREVELKHGRVCMLAALGFLVGEQFHPLFGGDIDVPSYTAFQQTPLQTFWGAVVAAIAIPEVFSVESFALVQDGSEWWTMKTDRDPGDFGFDPLGLKPSDPAEFKEMQTKELNNGRLAMIGAAGMIAQELVSGQKLFGN